VALILATRATQVGASIAFCLADLARGVIVRMASSLEAVDVNLGCRPVEIMQRICFVPQNPVFVTVEPLVSSTLMCFFFGPPKVVWAGSRPENVRVKPIFSYRKSSLFGATLLSEMSAWFSTSMLWCTLSLTKIYQKSFRPFFCSFGGAGGDTNAIWVICFNLADNRLRLAVGAHACAVKNSHDGLLLRGGIMFCVMRRTVGPCY